MAEPEKPVEEAKPTEVVADVSKPADKPAEAVAKAAEPAKSAGDDKSKPVDTKAAEKPIEESKSLLDEASEEEKKEGEAKVVPEKYEFKLPEGITLDEAAMKIVDPVFRELGLDTDKAQKLVDIQLALNKQNEEAHVKAFEEFVETEKQDAKKYFGTKLPEVMRNVARVRDQFVPEDLTKLLNVTGLSNNKHLLEFMDKIGRVVGEGKFITGKQSAPGRGDGSVKVQGATLADVYPSMATK